MVSALYENPDTRTSFLAQAQVDPQDTAISHATGTRLTP